VSAGDVHTRIVADRNQNGPVSAAGPLLELRDLRVEFRLGHRRIRAVDGLSYAISAGRTLAVIGESGSGKTVSSRAVMHLLPPTASVAGSVRFEGKELIGLSDKEMRKHRGADIAMVFQDPSRSLNPTMRIGAQLIEAVRTHLPLDQRAARERAIELLKLVRLPLPEQRLVEYPHQLSGGMRQRIVGAIAISCEPRLLIADEPTTSLDLTIQAQYLNLLRDLQRAHRLTLIFITHNLGIVAKMCDQVAVMYAGRLVESGPVGRIYNAPAHPYTRALLESIPRLGDSRKRLTAIDGQPPDPIALPGGCAFHPRCPKVMERCRAEAPPELRVAASHTSRCWLSSA
jgi:oligopeptide/dipeptide ABC transporter ATP-binding protein